MQDTETRAMASSIPGKGGSQTHSPQNFLHRSRFCIFLWILATPKCQRISAALEGREEVPHVGLGLQMLWGFRGFLKAEGAGRQKYLGQGSLAAQAQTMLPEHTN